MDNHPIPQDITGFKFKLIGQMTIKQFIYLAIGAVIAWVVFFGIDPPTIIKWPVAGLAIGIGAIVAFVPIDGRPMDTMIKNFFTALTTPTQFVYQKEPSVSKPDPSVSAQPVKLATPVPAQTAIQQPPPQPASSTQTAVPAPPSPPTPKTPAAPPPVLFPDEEKKKIATPTPEPVQAAGSGPMILPNEKEDMKKQIEELQKKLAEKEAKQEAAKITQPAPKTEQTPTTSGNQQVDANQLAEAQRQKEALEKQIIDIQAKQEAANTNKFEPVVAKPLEQTQNVRRVPADMAGSAGIGEAPDAPNLITGIVKDSRGNPIQNILIEVLDTDGNPVRAFKTNKLGKFASATSLSNGNYIIKFEDSAEKHKFDTVQIELNGSSVMPLEIISVDPREELRRELFN